MAHQVLKGIDLAQTAVEVVVKGAELEVPPLHWLQLHHHQDTIMEVGVLVLSVLIVS